MIRRSITLLVPGLLLLALAVTLQWAAGAYRAEFDDSDEAAHYVTGLMVRDYIASFDFSHPIRYAENYYLHYPKVGLGHWPPVFYLVQSAWTLVFPPSRASILLLMALLAALAALAIYDVARKEFSAAAGIALACLFIALPLVQSNTSRVMADILLALLVFVSIIAFGRYLDTERLRYSLLFGVMAALAILTKGTALALIPVPLLAVVLSRRFYLLARPATWLPVAIVAALCGPWYLMLPRVVGYRPERMLGLGKNFTPISQQSWQVLALLGSAMLIVAAIGFAERASTIICGSPPARGIWAASLALVPSLIGFRLLLGVASPDRHLLVMVPVLLLFLAAGLAWLGARLPASFLKPHQRIVTLAAALAVAFFLETFYVPRKHPSGFAPVAAPLMSKPELAQAAFLVSSEAGAEGPFIAEVAMREKRPGHYVLRSSKVLARVSWSGNFVYRLLLTNTEEVMAYLERIPVGVVIIDTAPGPYMRPHHRLLQEAVRIQPGWELIGSYPRYVEGRDTGHRILVYRRAGVQGRPTGEIRIDMTRRLGRVIGH